MTRLGIIEPKTLVGEAIRNAITESSHSFESIDLYTTKEDEIGAVTEVAGGAALVQALTEDSMKNIDGLLFCGAAIDRRILDKVPEDVRIIEVDPWQAIPDAVPAVAGVSKVSDLSSMRLVSPSPAVIMLAHLLAPVRHRGPLAVTAQVLLPASSRGQAGLDELFNQTRSILTMSEERPDQIFGTQLAFNLLPWKGDSANLGKDLRTVLGLEIEVHIQLSQAGVFHCLTGGVLLELEADPGLAELQDLLLEDPTVEAVEEPAMLGPVTAASSDRILLGEVTPSGAGRYWIWCVLDNLTASANNTLALAL